MNCVCGNFFGVFTPFFAKCCSTSVCSECLLRTNYKQLRAHNTHEMLFVASIKCPACKANTRRFRKNTSLESAARQMVLLWLNNKHIGSCSRELYDVNAFIGKTAQTYAISTAEPTCTDPLVTRLREYLALVVLRANEVEANLATQNKRIDFSTFSMEDVAARARNTSLAAALLKEATSKQTVSAPLPLINKHVFRCTINWKTLTVAFDENFNVMKSLAFVMKFGPATKMFGRWASNGFVRIYINRRTIAYVLLDALCIEDGACFMAPEAATSSSTFARPAEYDTSTDDDDNFKDDASTSTTGDMEALASDSSDDAGYEESASENGVGEKSVKLNSEEYGGELHWFKTASGIYAKRLARDVYVYCENLMIKSVAFNYFSKEAGDEFKHILDFDSEQERIERQLRLLYKHATTSLIA